MMKYRSEHSHDLSAVPLKAYTGGSRRGRRNYDLHGVVDPDEHIDKYYQGLVKGLADEHGLDFEEV
jgi:hypothetical protein